MTRAELNNVFRQWSTVSVNLLLFIMLFFVHDASAVATAPTISVTSTISDRLSTPLRLTVDRYGYIYVCDPRGGGILQYTNSGMFIQKIPTSGEPLGVAVVSSGDLVVTMGNSAAFVNPANLTEISKFIVINPPAKAMLNGVTVDPSGNIYITDTINGMVRVFNSNGTAIGSITGSGTAGELKQPTGIAYESEKQNIAVVDSVNGKVVFFKVSDYSFVKTVGGIGTGPLKFVSPQGVSFEYSAGGTLDRMYVLDSFQSNIQAIGFSVSDFPVFLRYMGSHPVDGSYKTPGKLIVPTDLAFDGFNSQSRKLIVSNGFGNLALFGVAGRSATQTGPALSLHSIPSVTNLASVTLSGSTDTTASITVILNGGAPASVTNSSGSFSTPVSLIAGANTITVVAAIGSSTTTNTVNVFRTDGATTLTTTLALTANPPSVTSNPSLPLAGTVTPASTVYVNGAAVIPVGNNWTHNVTLMEGANDINVSAGDATLSFRTILNTQPPLVYLAIGNNSTTSSPNISLSGFAEESYGIANGDLAIDIFDVTGTNRLHPQIKTSLVNGAFSVPLLLPTTSSYQTIDYKIIASFPDSTGIVGTSSRILTYNPSAPIVAVNTADWSTYKNPLITLTGTAPSGSTINVSRIDDSGAAILGSSFSVVTQGVSWTATGLLVQGNNQVIATVTSPSGTSSVVRNLVYEPSAPLLSLTSPYQDIGVTSTNGVYINGSVSSGVGVSAILYKDSVPLGTVPVTVTSSGLFKISVGNAIRSITGSAPTDGSYQFAVVASDNSGNVSTALRNIVVDSVKPVLSYASGQFTIGTGDTLVARSSSGSVTVSCAANVCSIVPVYDPATMNVFAVNSAGVSTRDGDINIDGIVDIRDLVMGIQVVVGILPALSENQMIHGDVGPMRSGIPMPNNKFTIEDLMLIMRKVVGIMW